MASQRFLHLCLSGLLLIRSASSRRVTEDEYKNVGRLESSQNSTPPMNVTSVLEASTSALDIECLCAPSNHGEMLFEPVGSHTSTDDCTLPVFGGGKQKKRKKEGDNKRCNELCEDMDGAVGKFDFDKASKRQTVSYCGDSTYKDKSSPVVQFGPKCHCLNLSHKMPAPDVFPAEAAGMVHQAYISKKGRRAVKTIQACYEGCPGLCAEKQLKLVGCAIPLSVQKQ